MQGDIPVRKAFRFEGGVQRVAGNGPAVDGKEDLLAGLVVIGIDIAFQPAFHPAGFIVIDPRAFRTELITAPETEDIKVPHIGPDLPEVFDQLTVGHDGSPPFCSFLLCNDYIIRSFSSQSHCIIAIILHL